MMNTENRWWEQWDKDTVAQTIENVWKNDLLGFENIHRQNLARLISTYYRPDMKKILEVGCGTGLVYQAIVPAIFENSRYKGVDISVQMLKIAQNNFPKGNFEWGDAFALKFGEKSFDLVFSFEVIVHLPEMDIPIAEMMRVANKAAIFTVWVAKEEEVVMSMVDDIEFIHHRYEHNKIIETIHKQAGNRPHRIEVRPLSDHTWAYVILFDVWAKDELYPFPGFLINFLSSTRNKFLEELTEKTKNLSQISKLKEEISLCEAKLDNSQNALMKIAQEQEVLQKKFDRAKNEIQEKQKKIDEGQREVYEAHRQTRTAIQTLSLVQEELSRTNQILNSIRRDRIDRIKVNNTSVARKIINIIRLFRSRASLEVLISQAFQQLRDDSYLYNSSLKNYLLQPSSYMNELEFLPYQVKFNRSNLCAVLVAPILEIPSSSGEIGIEIISPQNEIVRQVLLPLKNINLSLPVKFSFLEIAGTNIGMWGLRIFIKNADAPVQIFEWRKFSILSKGLIKRKPFLGFSFTTQN